MLGKCFLGKRDQSDHLSDSENNQKSSVSKNSQNAEEDNDSSSEALSLETTRKNLK